MQNDNEIAVAYLRVSTEDQTLNFSLEYQEEHIRSYCKVNNIELKKVYNEGYGSGTSVEDREVFCTMMADCLQSKEIDYVIVLADHRFARNHADSVNLVDRLIKSGTHLICVADRINTSNRSDYDYFKNKSIYSERHREEILFNCIYGMRQRAKNGLHNGGRITGYVTTSEGLKIDPDSSKIIKLIFDKCVNDQWGFRKIAQYLNKHHYKTINGNEFDINAVKTILTNPTYIGYIRFEEQLHIGTHESIIDKETWDKAQQMLKIRSYLPEKVHHGSYFLTGFLKCPKCNASMVHHVSSCGKYRYYKCLNNKNGKSCKANSIKKAYAEEYILSLLPSIIGSPKIYNLLQEKMKNRISNDYQEISKTLNRLHKDISIIDNKINKTYELYYKTNNNSHLIQIERLRTQHEALSERLNYTEERYNSLKHTDSVKIVDNFISNFESIFLAIDDIDKRRFLKTLFQEIHINSGDRISMRTIKSIIYNLDINEIPKLITA
ncbi:recombinase family protein [Bacillus massiliglaciei]|uniref:recombinase family protein n=1 Tax=Bacillus massiliglaciei TaxID=1816693 RepID=UPI000A5689AB|nr:recombinase family protein [Bacillus massiliglaciei]